MLEQRFPTYIAIKPHKEIQANYKQVEVFAAHQSEQESQKSKDISWGQSWQCHRTPWIGSIPQLSHCEADGRALKTHQL